MRHFLFNLILWAFMATVAAEPLCACRCGAGNHGQNPRQLAELQSREAAVIFEGTPEHFELQWNAVSAKEGELIPVSGLGPRDTQPSMSVTFRVQKTYKGDLGSKIRLGTGLGGGDCGAQFATGLTYLVYAYGSSLDELRVSMCSPGGWVGSDDLAADLRYLRNERPTSLDIASPQRWNHNGSAAMEEERQRRYEKFKQHYAAFTGKICGAVVRDGGAYEYVGDIAFLSTLGYSPVGHPSAQVNRDGSFCSDPLGPGSYFLYFTSGWDGKSTSAVYYPGVTDQKKAIAVEVRSGETPPTIEFRVPKQNTYSVRGVVFIRDKSDLNRVELQLVGLDAPREVWRNETVDLQGSFPLSNVKYFSFDNVPSGRYMPLVYITGKGRFLKKQEVVVTNHMKFISLEVVGKGEAESPHK